MRRALLVVVVALLMGSTLLPAPAMAHWADLAVAEILVERGVVRMTLTFPTGLAAAADDDRDGRLSAAEIGAHRAGLTTLLRERIAVTAGNVAAVLVVEALTSAVPANLAAPKGPGSGARATHSTVRLIYTWPETLPSGPMMVRYGLFLPGVSTASALATIVQDGTARSHVFTPENTTLTVARAGGVGAQVWSFLILGVKHILTGYDHVLFLITLLMAGGGLRALLKIVTAFTVAHSVTLTLAVLGVVTVPSRVVESGIALSIAYVAAENLWRHERALTRRWLVTFGFGLIHGLGFASILRDLAVGGANLATSLVSFNLGVEAGQILVVAAAFGLLEALRRAAWQPLLRRALSAGALAAGMIWFLQRAGGI
ncbi:MAG TPA: HupE/UreJ family protein [bacterium]|jgi:hypothetical protein|nr:HupE/UreJ family protein [bacterium]